MPDLPEIAFAKEQRKQARQWLRSKEPHIIDPTIVVAHAAHDDGTHDLIFTRVSTDQAVDIIGYVFGQEVRDIPLSLLQIVNQISSQRYMKRWHPEDTGQGKGKR